MATKVFIINDTSVTAGVDSTSSLGTSSIKWTAGWFSGAVTMGTCIATAGSFTTLVVVGSSTFGGILITDNRNVTVGTATGTIIATATNQKLAFYNATPVVQASATGETVGFTAVGGTNATDQSTFTGNVGTTAYRISDVVKALKNLGILKQ